MSEQEENELICEKLLGWEKVKYGDEAYDEFQPLFYPRRGDNCTNRLPTFTDWASAGMILEALARDAGKYPSAFPYAAAIGFDPTKRDWSAGAGSKSAEASTGPLAIRAAALEYIRSTL